MWQDYNGQTGRAVTERTKEYECYIRLEQPAKADLAQQCLTQ